MKIGSKLVGLGVLATLAVAVAQDAPAAAFPTLALDHPAAPFVMTHDYAKQAGATAEWRKMEGVFVDAPNNKLYIAMSEIGKGMSDGAGDIQLDENPCGIVYEAALDASFNISKLTPLVVGGPYDESAEENDCALGAIANPDNLAIDARGRVWIGEDTGLHLNNALWVYDPSTTQALTRFATVPLGAEVTGLKISDDGTLFMNVQHPDAGNVYPFNRGVIGVVTGFNANTDDFTELAVPEGEPLSKVAQVAAGDLSSLGSRRRGHPRL